MHFSGLSKKDLDTKGTDKSVGTFHHSHLMRNRWKNAREKVYDFSPGKINVKQRHLAISVRTHCKRRDL